MKLCCSFLLAVMALCVFADDPAMKSLKDYETELRREFPLRQPAALAWREEGRQGRVCNRQRRNQSFGNGGSGQRQRGYD